MESRFYGGFQLVLHTHIPWVMYHDNLEEEWLYEATAETYIPLLDVCNRLVSEGISPRITFTFSPVLLEQLQLEHYKERFIKYCDKKIAAAQKDKNEFQEADPHLTYLAERWEKYYSEMKLKFVEDYEMDLPAAFAKLQTEGHIEVMTCGATHAYFPACAEDTSIQAQVKIASDSYRKIFGKVPNGLWLPECGYRPACKWAPPVGAKSGETPYPRKGVEEFLSEADIHYFVVDNNQLMKAFPFDFQKDPFYSYWVTGPKQPKPTVAVLARDIPLSYQVWRHEIGYPGDGVYLDFHKKHGESRLRYWKITHVNADMSYKDYYYPDDAVEFKVKEHAGHYKSLIAQSLKTHFEHTGNASAVMTAFDTELFGHWWFEGPLFVYHLIKWVNQDPQIKTETCSDFLHRFAPVGEVHMPESSWGANYDSTTWINKEVAWVLDKEYEAERELRTLTKEYVHREDPELKKILQQCCRELMLLQSSDWKFMITNWSTRDHAERRVLYHFNDFKRLSRMARDYGEGRTVEESEWLFLGDCMARDRLFPDLDPKVFSDLEVPPVG